MLTFRGGEGGCTVSECTLRGYSARPPSLKLLLERHIQTEHLRERARGRDAQTFAIQDELKTYNTLLFTREHSLCSSNVMA